MKGLEGNYIESEAKTVEAAALEHLEASLLVNGTIEQVEDNANNLTKFCARLVQMLADKNLLTAPEVQYLLQGYSSPGVQFVEIKPNK